MDHKPEEYVWIKKWGEILGSYRYYIEQEQERAAHEDAPLNAIYRGAGKGEWYTTDSIINRDTRKRFGLG